MIIKVARLAVSMMVVVFLAGSLGCAGAPVTRTVIKPSESKRQYLGIKKIAVLPFNNIGGEKLAEEQAIRFVVNELNIIGTFDEIEDLHYVGSVLKNLKLRKIEELDLETIQKMGSEMNAQALLAGDIHAWGLGKGDAAAMQVSITLTLIDTQTGKPVWMGNGAHRASFTMNRALGLNEGPTDLEVGRSVIVSLVKDMDKKINDYREQELERIKAEESAKLKAAAEAEKRRLEEMMQEDESGEK
ncbi:MAG: hypothetical protein RRA15_10560 [bacterium]|nr:hypothetical protein [bacterium]